MALHLPGASDPGEEQALSTINTTPLVDVMLVLLIIFLITVPVIRYPQHVELPRQAAQARHPRASDVVISVTRDGRMYWGDARLADPAELRRRLRTAAALRPQPRVQISADRAGTYAAVGADVDAEPACRPRCTTSRRRRSTPRH
ncbi:MAG: biopolymer transporter ExbD [Betaproteobacteria bacterium]|nr:biopolymer transporter ExbD [Betaproteobacteria bacterium]